MYKIILTVLFVFASFMSYSAPNNKVICRGGHLFLIVWDYTLPNNSNKPVVVQIMKEMNVPQPIKCTKADEKKYNK